MISRAWGQCMRMWAQGSHRVITKRMHCGSPRMPSCGADSLWGLHLQPHSQPPL